MTRWVRKRERGYLTSLAVMLVLAGFYAVVSQFLPPPPGEAAELSVHLVLAGGLVAALGCALLVVRHRPAPVRVKA